jgi:hypothetical protein
MASTFSLHPYLALTDTKPGQSYTAEFNAHAVELMRTRQLPTQIAEKLWRGSNLLYHWKLMKRAAHGVGDGRWSQASSRPSQMVLR